MTHRDDAQLAVSSDIGCSTKACLPGWGGGTTQQEQQQEQQDKRQGLQAAGVRILV